MLGCKQLVERSSDYLDDPCRGASAWPCAFTSRCATTAAGSSARCASRERCCELPHATEAGIDALAVCLAASRTAQRPTGRTDPPTPRE